MTPPDRMTDDPNGEPGPRGPRSADLNLGQAFELALVAADSLTERLGRHRVAVVLGSGWAGIGDALGVTTGQMSMSDLVGVPDPSVSGHSGTIFSVEVARPGSDPTRVLVLAGRSHLYEGHSPSTVVHAVRSAVLHGCSRVVLTNAAGSLRPEVGVMSPVIISDQLNLTGANPMCGLPAPPPQFGDRFVDLSDLYSRRLIDHVHISHPGLVEGVYAGVLGGSYETPAEIRMLRTLGADLVGMSTVLESIAAHHLGAEVFGLSLVTNLAAGLQPSLAHSEVLAAGEAASGRLAEIISTVVTAP